MSERSRCTRGFTLVELLVVIAIIGLLLGVLLPAVQSVRESARQSSCRNNLRQLATAVQSYESANACLPPQGNPWQFCTLMNGGHPTLSVYAGQVSFLLWLLPFVEQQALGDQAITQIMNGGNVWGGPFAQQPPVLLCASEVNRGPGPFGSGCTNYRCNKGDIGAPPGNRSRGPFSEGSVSVGGTWSPSPVQAAHIRDGLSATVLLSEALIGTPANSSTLPAGVGRLGTLDSSTAPATCRALVTTNGYAATITDSRFQPGSMWSRSWMDTYTSFYTNASPNSPRCVADYDWYAFINPASSYHPGGVFVAMADTSVRFVDDSIDAGNPTLPQLNNAGTTSNAWAYSGASIRGVWGAMGTIRGGEVVSAE
jgi:prepilin-type N-terminal cleavage/methylation domain-containing protein